MERSKVKMRVGGIFEREFKLSEYPELQWFGMGVLWLLVTIGAFILHNPYNQYWIVGGIISIYYFNHSYTVYKRCESNRVSIVLYEGVLKGMERKIKIMEMVEKWKRGENIIVNNKITILGKNGGE